MLSQRPPDEIRANLTTSLACYGVAGALTVVGVIGAEGSGRWLFLAGTTFLLVCASITIVLLYRLPPRG